MFSIVFRGIVLTRPKIRQRTRLTKRNRDGGLVWCLRSAGVPRCIRLDGVGWIREGARASSRSECCKKDHETGLSEMSACESVWVCLRLHAMANQLSGSSWQSLTNPISADTPRHPRRNLLV